MASNSRGMTRTGEAQNTSILRKKTVYRDVPMTYTNQKIEVCKGIP